MDATDMASSQRQHECLSVSWLPWLPLTVPTSHSQPSIGGWLVAAVGSKQGTAPQCSLVPQLPLDHLLRSCQAGQQLGHKLLQSNKPTSYFDYKNVDSRQGKRPSLLTIALLKGYGVEVPQVVVKGGADVESVIVL